MIVKMILCLLLVMCLIGYFNYLVNVAKIDFWLTPAIIVASITAIIYLAGLINIIPVAEYLIIAFGVFLLFFYRNKISFLPIKENIIPGIMVLGLLAYVIWYNRGAIYPDGDTLNHWAWIVRSMIADDRFPNFMNRIIYQSYPPATACWTYFGMKIIGYSESKALILQNLATICYISSLFSLNKKHDVVGNVVAFLAMIPFLREFDGLKVDIILGAAAVAGFVVIAELYKRSKTMFLVLIPFAITITMIKNSGALFAVFFIITVTIAVNSTGEKKQFIKYGLSLSGITFAVWYLWQRHIKMVYINPTESRHSMSLDYTTSVIESRDSGYMVDILKNFVKKWFTANSSHEWILLALLVILTALAMIKEKDKKKVLTIPLCFGIYYFVYKIGVLAVYLINMPGEVLHMPSYERYHFTFSLVMIGALVWIFFRYLYTPDSSTAVLKYGSAAVLSVAVLFVVRSDQRNIFARPDYAHDGSHRLMETMIKDSSNNLGYGDCVLGYHHDTTNIVEDYVIYTTDNWASLGTDDPERVREALTTNEHGFDKVVILAEDENVEAVVKECGYGDSYDSGVIELPKTVKED